MIQKKKNKKNSEDIYRIKHRDKAYEIKQIAQSTQHNANGIKSIRYNK